MKTTGMYYFRHPDPDRTGGAFNERTLDGFGEGLEHTASLSRTSGHTELSEIAPLFAYQFKTCAREVSVKVMLLFFRPTKEELYSLVRKSFE